MKRSLGVSFLIIGILIVLRILSSHDEPIVVDNGPIFVRRAKADPKPESDKRHWALHHSAPLKQLHVWSWKDTSSAPLGLAQPESLSGVDEIVIELVDAPNGKPKERMSIVRDPWWKILLGQKARLHATVEFMLTSELALTPATNAEYLRIGQIRIDDRVVCLRDSERPQSGGCTKWNYTPAKVQLVVCAKADKCPQPQKD